MPKILINGCNYYYEDMGSGKETIVFSHGLLWSSKMFSNQIAYLKNDYRIISYDHRGQGQSEVTKNGYGIDSLYEDACELIRQLKLGKVHFAGLSMGGFIAMRIGARNPEMVKSLILMDTSAEGEPNKFKYKILNAIVKLFGVGPVINPITKIMFGEKFLSDDNKKEFRSQLLMELKNLNKSIVKATEGVINRKGIEDEIHNITCPTLIMVGTQDVATVPVKAEFIHRKIKNSQLKYIEVAGHSSSMEEPDQVNEFIGAFLKIVKK